MRRKLSLLILLFTSCLLFAQEYITSVNHYSLEDGLSHNQADWIFQDRRGMVWVGAANGINRYDGKEFKLIEEADFFYAGNNNILEDNEGDLWLVKNYWNPELFFFNTQTEEIKTFEEKFKTAPPFDLTDFSHASQLKDSTILISTKSKKLYNYTREGVFKLIQSLNSNAARLISIPQTFDFWILEDYLSLNRKELDGTFSILWKHKLEKGKTNFGLTKEGTLLLGDTSQTYTAYSINGETQNFNFPEFFKNKNGQFQNYAYDSEKDQFVNVLNGVVSIMPRQYPDSVFVSDYIKSLEDNNQRQSLYKNDVYWIGNFHGLSKLQIKTSPFKRMAYKNPDHTIASEMESCRLIRDYIRDEYFNQLPDFKNKNDYWTYFVDQNERIWFGGYYGLYYADKGEQRMTKFKRETGPASFLKNRVYQIFSDNLKQNWVVCANGLFLLDTDKELVERYSPETPNQYLPSNELRHMYQDAEGIYWIASYDGLIRWNKKTNHLRLFTTKDGLSNNHIMAVYEDEYGFLWLSSDNGIMQFEKSTERVKVYLPEDGITHREFNRGAHLRDENGVIYFGSLNGITYFHPKDFVERFYEVPNTPLLLTECTILSNETGKQENKMMAWLKDQKIILQPGDQHLQLKFSLLDYVSNNPNVVQYVYSMDDNKEWDIENGNVINFNGLSYGNHLLKVKGRTGNGLFSNQELNIPITVLKPFYLQNWFLILCGFGFISLLFIIQKAKTRSLIRRQQTLEKEVRERTHKIEAQAEELRQMDKTKSRFLANISHEFRTPLTLILNTLNQDSIDKLTENDASIMRRNAGRLQQLIDQLLDLSKLEAGKMKLNLANGDFPFYLRELIESFKPLAQKNKLTLTFNSTISEKQVRFDRDKVDKIIYNLLSNAIKFTPEMGNILVELSEVDQDICIEVKDSGVGIPSEEQSKVFDRFYQVNTYEDYSYEGTGLGLALVQELVEVQQGSIDLKSQKDQGSSFKIYLPFQKATTLSSLIPSVETPPSLAPIHQTNLEVSNNNKFTTSPSSSEPEEDRPILLIIEDNTDLLYHHQKTLSKDYQLHLAKDGEEGLEKAFKYIPDLIICDIMMPGKNGYEVCQILKSDEKTNHIPIILLTAKAGQESKIKGLSFGANGYLTKPYNQKELSLRILNLLKQRAQLQKQFQSAQQAIIPVPKFLTPQEQFVKKCEDIVEEQITKRNFGVEELSQELNMSRTHLFRKLKSITGITPTVFIRTYRLQKAKNLLSQHVGNGSEVSYMVGFSNPNYFFKCFKDEYSMTVGEFLSQLQVDV